LIAKSNINRIFFPFLIALLIGTSLPFFSLNFAEAFEKKDFKFYGYLDLNYTRFNKNPGKKKDSFDGSQLNLLLDYSATENLILKSQFEIGNEEDTFRNLEKVETEYLFAQYFFSDALQVRGGTILTPFGIFNEIHNATPAFLTVEIPLNIYEADDRGGFNFFSENNLGGSILGNYFFKSESFSSWEINYSAYIGESDDIDSPDPMKIEGNPNKAIGAQLNVSPSDLLTFGFSFFSEDDALFNLFSASHTTFLGSAIFNKNDFNLTFEAVYSKLSGAEQVAFFAQTSYLFKKLSPYYRFEYTDPFLSQPDDQWKTHIFGLNYKLFKSAVLKSEINIHDTEKNNASITVNQESFNEVKAAIAIAF